MDSAAEKKPAREAIVADGVTKWFGEGDTKTITVNHVDFVAHYGEILFIVGPSGSGKTTLLSMVSGILRPNEGTVTVNGVDIWTLNNDQLANFRLHTIGFVFQDYHLFSCLTSAENVAIPLILKQRDWNESIAEATKYLEIVGLKNRAEILPVKLSGGEQQRVAIARASSAAWTIPACSGARNSNKAISWTSMPTTHRLRPRHRPGDCRHFHCARIPNYAAMITFWNLELAFGMVLLIAGISSYFGVRKVLKIEPFDIFRG